MSKRRFIATLGAASVLMLAAGPGGFFDSETATGQVSSGTLSLLIDHQREPSEEGAPWVNTCRDQWTRGASPGTGAGPWGAGRDGDRRVYCIRNAGTHDGVLSFHTTPTWDEASCPSQGGAGQEVEGSGGSSTTCTDRTSLRYRHFRPETGERAGECRDHGGPHEDRPVSGWERPTTITTLAPGEHTCVLIRAHLKDKQTDVESFELRFTLETAP